MDKIHILQEIKRTAAANGGTPLGWRRFISETGIKQTDWLGVYWARWSEAVREAGFTPNQLTGAYETVELLDRYAQLALELGKLPTSADLRLKAHNDPRFPDEKTYARFGSKAEVVIQLLKYCQGRKGYEQIVLWCEDYSSRRDHSEVSVSVREVQIGFVYLLKSGRFYKIGKTNATGRREYELSIQLPERVTPVHVIRTDDPAGIEAYWHKRFETKRKNGEWFDLDAADITAFKRRKFM